MRKQAVNLEGLAERLRLRVVALELGGCRRSYGRAALIRWRSLAGVVGRSRYPGRPRSRGATWPGAESRRWWS